YIRHDNGKLFICDRPVAVSINCCKVRARRHCRCSSKESYSGGRNNEVFHNKLRFVILDGPAVPTDACPSNSQTWLPFRDPLADVLRMNLIGYCGGNMPPIGPDEGNILTRAD